MATVFNLSIDNFIFSIDRHAASVLPFRKLQSSNDGGLLARNALYDLCLLFLPRAWVLYIKVASNNTWIGELWVQDGNQRL